MSNTQEKWITVAQAQKLLRNPRTGRQPDKKCIYRWCFAGYLTHRRVRFGRQRLIEVLEHEVKAMQQTEGRIERRIKQRDERERIERRQVQVLREEEERAIAKRHGLEDWLN